MQGRKLEIRSLNSKTLSIGNVNQKRFGMGSVIPVPERDYEKLSKKPQINGVELIGNKTTRQLGIEVTDPLTNLELEAIIQNVMEG